MMLLLFFSNYVNEKNGSIAEYSAVKINRINCFKNNVYFLESSAEKIQSWGQIDPQNLSFSGLNLYIHHIFKAGRTALMSQTKYILTLRL